MEEMHQSFHERIKKLIKEIQELYATSEELTSPIPELEPSQVEAKIIRIYKKIERGVHKIANLLNDPEFFGEYSHLIHSMADMATVATVVIKQMDPALTMLGNGASLQETLGITDESLNSIYQLSKFLYEHQHYEEASGAFYLLSLLCPSCPTYWLGLGQTEYFLANYQEALLCFSFATHVHPEDPLYHILSARCHKALRNDAAALASLGIAELNTKKTPEHAGIRKQIESLRNELQRRIL
jgi:tetratricopeptide (TPR) repeat protein